MRGYASIDRMIQRVREVFASDEQKERCHENIGNEQIGAHHNPAKIAVMFEKCISNTLETTLRILEDGSVFVITGDIPAMWLRDSACQLRPFILFAKEEPELQRLIAGVVKKQVQCILIDPYANAFNESANGKCYSHDKTKMNDNLWERKYEIDSLCYPVQLAYLLWKNTGFKEHFTEDFRKAAKEIIRIFRIEQDHEHTSDYLFERENCPFTDTLSRDGKGALVKSSIGLTWSGFRPSDDACVYGYLIPSNMLASVILSYMSEIAEQIYQDAEFASKAMELSQEIRMAVEHYGIVPNEETEFYAYEVDGYGQYLIMDDANLPSLLSMPYFGYCDTTDIRYQNTRNVILSDRNPYYYEGKYAKGIGSPHTKPRYVWDIALAMEGLTADSKEEKRALLELMSRIDADTYLMHEAIDVDEPKKYTRPWFSWANSVFCELVMDYLGERVEV